jgi:LCP family protein required for cell wall assembly
MRRRPSTRMRVLGWTSIVLTTVLVAGTLGLYIAVRAKLEGITRIRTTDTKHRPPKYNNALNILLLGSDSRVGGNAAIGGAVGCNCSDTILLAHFSPGRKKVTVLSIPRDTMVPLYACVAGTGLPGQQADPAAFERINATLQAGGPECVRETIEQQTGIRIDNVILLTFAGFEKVINDIGGVNVCLPFAIHNTITASGGSGLDLTAGRHHIDGRVALEFWRTRENVADGSDTARIARDQYLMAQIVKGVLHSGLLTSPGHLYTVIGDVAKAMTTDASIGGLLHIGSSLNGVSTKNVQFITTPTTPWPQDPTAELEFAQPQAGTLFSAIAHDSKLPKIKKTGKGSGGGVLLTTSPSKVKVMVLNGSGITNQAGNAATALASLGFDVVGTGSATGASGAPDFSYVKSVIKYASAADLPAANTLREHFSLVRLKLVPTLTPGTIEVVLGSTFTALASPSSSKAAQPVTGLSTSYGGITASARCRNSAFYGYYDTAPTSGKASCSCAA